MKNQIQKERPSVQLLESELARLRERKQYHDSIRTTLSTILTLFTAALLAATLWFPVLRVYGSSMSPTLSGGDVLICLKSGQAQPGDVIAFHHNNKILVKRVIAQAGDMVDISPDGIVSVNGNLLEEPYISEAVLGEADLEFPCQVPNGSFFVMGDHRSTSLDSRSSAIGFVTEERIMGKILLRIWPLNRLGSVS